MAEKILTLEEANALNVELKASNDVFSKSDKEQKQTIADLKASNDAYSKSDKEQKQTITDLNSKIGDLTKKLTSSEGEVKVSGDVVEDLKKKIANLETAVEASEVSKTIHKFGKKKYRLLYGIRFNGAEVTDEVLSGNEKLLGELIESGSGAIQVVE